MKHTKKNLAILYSVVTSTMTHGLLVAAKTTEDTCVIPSLLADRKKSDTFNVCIPAILTRSVTLGDTTPTMASETYKTEVSSTPVSLLEEITLRSVPSHIDFDSNLLQDAPDSVDVREMLPVLEIPGIDSQTIAPDETISFRSLDLGLNSDETLNETVAELTTEVVPSAAHVDEVQVSQEFGAASASLSALLRLPKKAPAKTKSPATQVTKTKMQNLIDIIQKSHTTNAQK